jgi:Lon protease-like protein
MGTAEGVPMTEPGEGAPGRRELPLFPLSTVLFPGTILPLHIFEERYRTMVRRCLRLGRPEFVVLLIKEGDEVVESLDGGSEVGRPPQPYPVGTVARILEAGEFPDGRFLLSCVGTERIELQRVVRELPYLVGEVEPLHDEDEPGAGPAWEALVQGVREGITALLEAVREVSPSGDTRQRLQLDAVLRAVPTDPAELSFFVPQVLTGASAEERQRLLDTRTVRQRLRLEQRLLGREQQHVRRLKRAGSHLRFEVGLSRPSLN